MSASPWMVPLWYAIQTRLATDSTLVDTSTGLLGPNGAANIRTGFGPPSADPPPNTYPNILLWPMNEMPDRTFDTRRMVEMITLKINVLRKNAASGYDPLARMAAIHERILGDWAEQTTKTPTYGLDNWTGTFVGQTGGAASTYKVEDMLYMGMNVVSDDSDDLLQWYCDFQVGVSKVRP